MENRVCLLKAGSSQGVRAGSLTRSNPSGNESLSAETLVSGISPPYTACGKPRQGWVRKENIEWWVLMRNNIKAPFLSDFGHWVI